MIFDLTEQWSQIQKFKKLTSKQKSIVFYSETEGYWSHYKPIIDELLQQECSDQISYLSSSKNDPGLELINFGIQAFYIGNGSLRTALLNTIDSKILVMSTPDLQSFQIKRSVHPVHYVYVHHSIISTHMGYQENAFDNFDTIFCVGPHHKHEILASEKKRSIKTKNLVQHGYGRLDSITFNKNKKSKIDDNTILIAPSWGKHSILDTVGEEIIEMLLTENFKVIVRPHPQTMRLNKKIIDRIIKNFGSKPNFSFEENISSEKSLHESSLMVSDWSGAAIEYAFGLKKPVLFIDVPLKINNQKYQEINIEPIEISIRDEVGKIIGLDEIKNIGRIAKDLIAKKDFYIEKIISAEQERIYNLGKSGKVAANELLRILSSIN